MPSRGLVTRHQRKTRISNMTTEQIHIAGRIGAALLGGYVFTWGGIALGVAGLFAAGMEFHDAEHLCNILGFLVFLVVFLWAFAARSMPRVWLVLLGGGGLMTASASLIQHMLV
ncbi:Iron uptake protein [Bordetella tumbae]